MSPPKESDRRANAARDPQRELSGEDQGVLSKLPRTRPQRSSPRRAAARAARASAADTAPAHANGHPSAGVEAGAGTAVRPPKRSAPARGAGGSRRARRNGARAPTASAAANVEPAPRQGFECESERTGGTVQPPGGADLIASAAEIVGELAKGGVSKGERLLRDLFSHLPLS